MARAGFSAMANLADAAARLLRVDRVFLPLPAGQRFGLPLRKTKSLGQKRSTRCSRRHWVLRLAQMC